MQSLGLREQGSQRIRDAKAGTAGAGNPRDQGSQGWDCGIREAGKQGSGSREKVSKAGTIPRHLNIQIKCSSLSAIKETDS